MFDTKPQVGFGGLPASTSISIVPTPVAAVNSNNLLAVQEESDIINGISTNDEADDREDDELEELESDDCRKTRLNPSKFHPRLN